MQGTSDLNAEFLDAAALCRHLVPDDSVQAFLADHRRELFPNELFADLFPSGRHAHASIASVSVTGGHSSDRDSAISARRASLAG